MLVCGRITKTPLFTSVTMVAIASASPSKRQLSVLPKVTITLIGPAEATPLKFLTSRSSFRDLAALMGVCADAAILMPEVNVNEASNRANNFFMVIDFIGL
ncbi:hypothetical protein D3C72_1983030 [compost metagenome]